MPASESQKKRPKSGSPSNIAQAPKKANVVPILTPQSEAREGAGSTTAIVIDSHPSEEVVEKEEVKAE